MFTLLTFSVEPKTEDNLSFEIYNLSFKYSGAPNPCVNALGGTISMNFDLVNYLNCSSILSDFINLNIIDYLEAGAPRLLLFIKNKLGVLRFNDEYYKNNIPEKYFQVVTDPIKKTETNYNSWTLLYYFFMLNSEYNLETFFHDGTGIYKKDNSSTIFSFDKPTFITILINFINGNNNQQKTDDLSKLFNALELKKNEIVRILVAPLGLGESAVAFFNNTFKLDLTDPEGRLGKLILPVGVFAEQIKNAHQEGYEKEVQDRKHYNDNEALYDNKTNIIGDAGMYLGNQLARMFRNG
jgi:hypothetical protein